MEQTVKGFVIPIFNIEISILIGDKAFVNNYLQDTHNRVLERGATNVVTETIYSDKSDVNEYIYIVLYNDIEIKDSAYNIIHECLHASYRACILRGIEPNEELLCYLQGFIISEVFECLNAELTVVTSHL